MFIPASCDNLIEKDKKRIDEILKASGMKKTVKVLGKSYYVSKRFAKEFKILMIRVNKYCFTPSNNLLSIINSPFLSFKSKGTKILKDKNRYVGKIVGFDGHFDEVDTLKDDNLRCIGTINVDSKDGFLDNKDDVSNYDNDLKNDNHHNYKKNRLKIFGKRQASNINKIRRNIIKSSIAIALSLVTAVTAFGISKISFWKNSEVDGVTNSYVDIDDTTYDSNKNQELVSNFDDKLVNNSIMFNKFDNNEFAKVEDTKKSFVSSDNVEDNSLNVRSISLNDEITIDDDAYIYTNAYDACCENDGLDPYYDSNYVRNVRGVAFEDDNSVVFAYTQEEYDYLNSKGAIIKAVGCDDGFYNIDDVKVLSYSR